MMREVSALMREDRTDLESDTRIGRVSQRAKEV
jgi:hypothetical protein